jgi:hypothetical protein
MGRIGCNIGHDDPPYESYDSGIGPSFGRRGGWECSYPAPGTDETTAALAAALRACVSMLRKCSNTCIDNRHNATVLDHAERALQIHEARC